MPDHELKLVIEAADRAITAEDFDALMDFYAEDAILVVQPGRIATGKQEIRKAFTAIAEYFNHKIKVTQGDMQVIEAGDTALVIMETLINTHSTDGTDGSEVRRATYVFRRNAAGNWLCVIDNSYGTALLDGQNRSELLSGPRTIGLRQSGHRPAASSRSPTHQSG